MSRLARNNADWHRLLEICALADTLILDEDGVYDPTNFNDRLLLGLNGTMSEAELHVLEARLRPAASRLRGRRSTLRSELMIADRMTPAAVELALEIRREIEARQEESDRLRRRAIERAQVEADLAQRRFMLVDPNNRLVADTLEAEWNDKLRIPAKARDERERGRHEDQVVIDTAIRERLVAMTTDFRKIWTDPKTSNRDRKRMLEHIVEDTTLIKQPSEGGIYVCSEATMYRDLKEEKQLRRRDRAREPKSRRPAELIATGPGQVWSWDITYLRSPVRGMFFYCT